MSSRTEVFGKSLRSETLLCLLVGLVNTLNRFYSKTTHGNGNAEYPWYLMVEFVVYMAAIMAVFNENENYEYFLLTSAISFSFLDILIGFYFVWEIHNNAQCTTILCIHYIVASLFLIFKIYSASVFCNYLTALNKISAHRTPVPKVYYQVSDSPTAPQNGQMFYIIPNSSSIVPYPTNNAEFPGNPNQPPQYSNQPVCNTTFSSSPPPEYSRTANQFVV